MNGKSSLQNICNYRRCSQSGHVSDVLGKTKEKINRIKYYLKYICSIAEFLICISLEISSIQFLVSMISVLILQHIGQIVSQVIKHICKICDNNSNKKPGKINKLLTQNKRTESFCPQKRTLCFSKRAVFLYKRALRQSRGAAGGRTPLSRKLFFKCN